MPTYILTPTLTKSIAEFDTWSNSADEEVITVRYWRIGEISVTCDEMPVIEVDPNNGVNLMEYFEKEYFDGKLNYSLDDCYYTHIYSCPDSMRRKRKERLEDLWEEYNDLEEDGWDIAGTEVWIYCEMTVKESQ